MEDAGAQLDTARFSSWIYREDAVVNDRPTMVSNLPITTCLATDNFAVLSLGDDVRVKVNHA